MEVVKDATSFDLQGRLNQRYLEWWWGYVTMRISTFFKDFEAI